MKDVDSNNKKANKDEATKFTDEDEKSFFFSSVFSFTKRIL
jgi:hypothetical protein